MAEKEAIETRRANDALRKHLIETLTQGKYLNFWDLRPGPIINWLQKMAISDSEIRYSPGYFSAGWGHNQNKDPLIEESDLIQSRSNDEHEAKHGLHNLKCQTIYETEDWAKYIILFKKNVLGDESFVSQIEKPGGSSLQERMLKKARELTSAKKLSGKDVRENVWIFGALTYQHAYFVDPGMCEAAASYGDSGITFAVGFYNRWFSTLFIPKTQYFEGYTNGVWQEKFSLGNDEHKALLIKSEDYNRDEYWK